MGQLERQGVNDPMYPPEHPADIHSYNVSIVIRRVSQLPLKFFRPQVVNVLNHRLCQPVRVANEVNDHTLQLCAYDVKAFIAQIHWKTVVFLGPRPRFPSRFPQAVHQSPGQFSG